MNMYTFREMKKEKNHRALLAGYNQEDFPKLS